MLHAGPYKGELEDRLAFLTSLCLTLSLLLGLCLMMDDASNPIFPADEIGIILILINVLPFVHFVFSCVQLIRHGAGVGIGNSVANGVVDSSEMVNVVDPSDNDLSRTRTFSLVKKAVDHDKVLKIQGIHRASRNRLEKKIQQQASRADARVRKRLSNKRKKKSAQHQQTKGRQVGPVADDYTLEIQKFRTKLASAASTPEQLMVLFNKLDKNKDGTLSKEEFSKVAIAVIKPKSKKTFDKVFNAVWEDARQLRKRGRGIDELDFDTLRSWTFGNRVDGAAQKTTS